MNDWERQLPRSNTAHPNETLAGYLLNLAHRLDLPPHELIRRTGIKPIGRISLLDLTYATRLPPETRQRFTTTTGLTDQEAINLTTERFGPLLHMGATNKPVARSEYGNQWLTPGRTRLCPHCLHNTETHTLWHINWVTAWALTCTHHNNLLTDTCPDCHTPIGEPGPQGFRSLIPQPTLGDLHPAACRAWVAPKRACGARLDEINPPTADPAAHDLQQRLDAALTGTLDSQQVLGVTTTPHQWLKDLRLVTILLQIARDPRPLESNPYPDAATNFIRNRTPNEGRTAKGTRTATQPPDNTEAATGILLTANELLNGDGEPETLNALAKTAATLEPVMWATAQNKTQSSDGLTEALTRHKKALTKPTRLRAYTATNTTHDLQPEHVPPYLDNDTFHRHFNDVRGPSNAPTRNRYERPLRRYAPIALVMLLTNNDATTAGAFLGYTPTSVRATTARASDAFNHLGEPELLRRITNIANELTNTQRTDWQHRRNWFTPDWTIPEHHWTELQRAVPRKNTPWEKRRPAFASLIWAITTSSDVKDAPMTLTTTNGRTNANGGSTAAFDLLNRGGPTLRTQIDILANKIAHEIDNT